MEDAGDLPSLKSWLRADTPPSQITSVGQSLGSYLAHIHNTTADDSALKAAFSSNTIAKNVSSSVYFAALPAAAEKYGYTQPFIAAAAQYAAEQVLTANEVWTLGDFWTGNVLVSWTSSCQNPVRRLSTSGIWVPRCFVWRVSGTRIKGLCCLRRSSARIEPAVM
jgi:hypothetical protein